LPDNLILNVRQLAQYALRTAVDPTDLVLLQVGGLGGPYYSATAESVLATTGFSPAGPFVWGVGPPPADASADQIITGGLTLPQESGVLFNAYISTAGSESYWQAGPAGSAGMLNDGTFRWAAAPSGSAGAAIGSAVWTTPMLLSPGGHLTLTDTLTVGRDPTAPFEVATMGYVTAHTVASFNTRTGAVTLTLADVTGAGGAPIASPAFTGNPTGPTAALNTSTAQLATTAFVVAEINSISPDVHSFNGRSGVVTFLTADFNAATAVLTDPVPTAPTAAPGTSTGQLATTAFVATAIVAAVVSFNGRTGAVTLTAADITGAGGALLASPAFSGLPTAPTANPGTSTGQLATTAFVQAAIVAATTGVASWNGRTGAVVLNQSDIVNAAGWASPSFTGVPLAPTAATATNTTQIATTAFVHAAITAGAPGVTTFNTRSGAVTLTAADVTGVGGALLAGPAFTGTPTANTAAPGTNTNQLATTAFVAAALAAISTGVTSFNGRTGPVVLQGNDVSAAGGALVASPTFTGVPSGPTATTGTSTTQLATTQFVMEEIAANISGVSTWNGRAGAVTMTIADITAVGGAPVASPAFTGVPAGPTAVAGTNTQQLATTAFVAAALAAAVVSFNGRSGAVTLTAADITAVGGAVGSFLPLAGGTLSGALSITPNSGGASLVLNKKSSGVSCDISGQLGSTSRWLLRLGDDAAESGGNAGSNFALYRFNDGGSAIDVPLSITRSTGQAYFGMAVVGNGGFNANGGNPRYGTSYDGAAGYAYQATATNTTNAFWGVVSNPNGNVGSINCSGSATTFATTSDLRLKRNAVPYAGSGDVVDRTEIVAFDWIVDGSRGIGVLAQEAAEIFPAAFVPSTGNPGDANFMPWMVDHSKYVPVLLAELKALRARVRALEQGR
jgi:hypothetical protein